MKQEHHKIISFKMKVKVLESNCLSQVSVKNLLFKMKAEVLESKGRSQTLVKNV